MAIVAEYVEGKEAPNAEPQNQCPWNFFERHGLLLVCISPLVANIIGSIFNVLYNRQQIEPMLSVAQQQRFGGIAGKLAELARQQMLDGETPALEPLASALHQTPRTVRRRLQEQGLTFRQLLDTVRAELDNYLELQGLSRAQIAEQLGYSDTPAYLNARKRWAG